MPQVTTNAPHHKPGGSAAKELAEQQSPYGSKFTRRPVETIDQLKSSTVVRHVENGDAYTVMAAGKMETMPKVWVPSVTFRKFNTCEVFTRTFEVFKTRFEIEE